MVGEYLKLRSIEEQLEALSKQKDELLENEEVKQGQELMQKLEEIMETYKKTPEDLIALLAPPERVALSKEKPVKSAASAGKEKSTRKVRKIQWYTNPKTDEVIAARTGNIKLLRGWKEMYGAEVVDGWKSEDKPESGTLIFPEGEILEEYNPA